MYTAQEQVKSDFAEAAATIVGGKARMQNIKCTCVYARARVCESSRLSKMFCRCLEGTGSG